VAFDKVANRGPYNLYCSTDIVRVIKRRRMKWEECSTHESHNKYLANFIRRT
jgi:hypothetical protein